MNNIKRILNRARGLLLGLIAWDVELDDGTLATLTTTALLNGDIPTL